MTDEEKVVNALEQCSICNSDTVIDAIDLIERISAELEQVKRERDAAVKDMHELGKCCYSCKHYTENKSCQQFHCDLLYSGWEWRGICIENNNMHNNYEE